MATTGREGRHRPSSQTVLTVAALIMSVVATGLVWLIPNPGKRPTPEPTGGAANTSPSEQFECQIKLQDSRRALFEGNVYVTANREVEVGRSFLVRVGLCGPEARERAWCASEVGPSGVGQSPAGKVLLGGRVQVRLVSTDDHLRVVGADPAQDEPQPLTGPGDVGVWTWEAEAKTPDTYTMLLIVRLLDGQSDNPLVPDDYLPIELTARRVAANTQPSSGETGGGPTVSASPSPPATSQVAAQPTQGDAGPSTFDRVVLVLAQVVVPIVVALIGAGLLRNRTRRRASPGGSPSADQPPTTSP